MAGSRFIAVLASLVVAACVTEPHESVDLLLSGAWEWGFGNAAGAGLTMNLRTVGRNTSGTGAWSWWDGSKPFAVSGSFADTSRTFELDITYADGGRGVFAGRVFGADSLSGTWAPGDSTTWFPATSWFRPFVPPCSDSAPLLGMYEPSGLGFVSFRNDVAPPAEAALLAARYGFSLQSVYVYPLQGFTAYLSWGEIAVLRCEPSVTSVVYDTLSAARDGAAHDAH